jgi:hypothetical protein
MFFPLFIILNLETFCRGELLKLVWISVAKFEVGLWYCYFRKKITHLGFQALIYVI